MIIHVKVKPNSPKNLLTKIAEKDYVAEVAEAPENGKANQKLINLLAKEFGVSVKNVKIKNPSSRKKVVEIRQ